MDVFNFLSSRYNVERKRVPIHLIQKKIELYPRVTIDTETVRLYCSAMKAGEQFPPVILTNDYVLIDGFHRTEASILIGKKEIDAIVILSDLTRQEKISLAAELNLRHGKRLTDKDLERVKKIISEDESICIFSKYAQNLLNLSDVSDKMILIKDSFGEEEEESMASVLEEEEIEETQEEDYEDVFAEEEESYVRGEFERELESGEEERKGIFWDEKQDAEESADVHDLRKSREVPRGSGGGLLSSGSLVRESLEEVERDEEEDEIEHIYTMVEEVKKNWIKQTYNLYGTILSLIKKARDRDWAEEQICKTATYTFLYVFTLLRDAFCLLDQKDKLGLLSEFVKDSQKFFEDVFKEVWTEDRKREWENSFEKFLVRLKEMQAG